MLLCDDCIFVVFFVVLRAIYEIFGHLAELGPADRQGKLGKTQELNHCILHLYYNLIKYNREMISSLFKVSLKEIMSRLI